MDEFGQRWIYSGKSGCNRTIVVVLGQIVCFGDKVVVFGKKLLYSGKSCCTRAIVVVFGKNGCIRPIVVVFGQ